VRCELCGAAAVGLVVVFHHHSSTRIEQWLACDEHGEQYHEPNPLYGMRPTVFYRGIFR
jgi:hypothetical protein